MLRSTLTRLRNQPTQISGPALGEYPIASVGRVVTALLAGLAVEALFTLILGRLDYSQEPAVTGSFLLFASTVGLVWAGVTRASVMGALRVRRVSMVVLPTAVVMAAGQGNDAGIVAGIMFSVVMVVGFINALVLIDRYYGLSRLADFLEQVEG